MNNLTQAEKENQMGFTYLFLDNEKKDCNKAKYWLERAAEVNNADALNNLGMIYFIGCNVDRDYEKAEKYFLLANENGSHLAKANLGGIYRNGGYGLESDHEKALSWFRAAVDDEPKRAYDGLASIYIDQKNYEEAYKYVVKAADLGHPQAEYNLGYYYYTGTVVEKDKEKAKYWFEKAAAQGNTDAKFNLNILLNEVEQ